MENKIMGFVRWATVSHGLIKTEGEHTASVLWEMDW
ncbi:unnamed protein product, partial [marine sediment metagenome]